MPSLAAGSTVELGDIMFLHVIAVTYLEDYKLGLTFNNGKVKDVDLQGELWGPVFAPFKDPALFRQVRISETRHTIEWPNGADLAPEFLDEIGKEVLQPAESEMGGIGSAA